jgi:hypothetical protein
MNNHEVDNHKMDKLIAVKKLLNNETQETYIEVLFKHVKSESDAYYANAEVMNKGFVPCSCDTSKYTIVEARCVKFDFNTPYKVGQDGIRHMHRAYDNVKHIIRSLAKSGHCSVIKHCVSYSFTRTNYFGTDYYLVTVNSLDIDPVDVIRNNELREKSGEPCPYSNEELCEEFGVSNINEIIRKPMWDQITAVAGLCGHMIHFDIMWDVKGYIAKANTSKAIADELTERYGKWLNIPQAISA